MFVRNVSMHLKPNTLNEFTRTNQQPRELHMTARCDCGHEKKDHRPPVLGNHMPGSQVYGECKICLCNRYTKTRVPEVSVGPK